MYDSVPQRIHTYIVEIYIKNYIAALLAIHMKLALSINNTLYNLWVDFSYYGTNERKFTRGSCYKTSEFYRPCTTRFQTHKSTFIYTQI